MRQLKTISIWGTKHPIKARIIIIVAHLILLLSSVYFGITSYIYDVRLPYEIIPVLVSTFFLAYLFYPKRGHQAGWWKHSYVRQKTMDGILIVSSFLLLTLGVHRFAVEPIHPNGAKVQLIVNTTPHQKSETLSLRKTFKNVKKQIKNELRELKRTVKQSKTAEKKSSTAFLVFLTVLLFVFMIALSIGLSCHLGCSGYDTLATVVLIGGVAASLWLMILIFNRLSEKNKI